MRGEGLSAVEVPAILLDRTGRVVQANARAEAILCPEFTIHQGRISSNAEVSAAIGRVLFNGKTGQAGGVLETGIVYRFGKRPIIVNIVRIEDAVYNPFSAHSAIVTLIDLEASKVSSSELLQKLFGLTKVQARVAQTLSLGLSLEDVARELGISKETARTHLKSIFARMDLSRQSELVALLARITARPA